MSRSVLPVHTITPSSPPVSVSPGPSSPGCSNQHTPASGLIATCSLPASHRGYAALILRWQLSLSLCVFLLAAPSTSPLLRPTTPHCSPSHQAPDPQGRPPAPAAFGVHLEQENSKTPITLRGRLGPPASSCLQLN